jgi:hypothetical protein
MMVVQQSEKLPITGSCPKKYFLSSRLVRDGNP